MYKLHFKLPFPVSFVIKKKNFVLLCLTVYDYYNIDKTLSHKLNYKSFQAS